MISMIQKMIKTDFEGLGYQTMRETGDEMIAKQICALHIYAFADEVQPELARLSLLIQQTKDKRQALCSHLYDRDMPVSDTTMLGQEITLGILLVMISVALIASAGGHTMAFHLFGFGLPTSLLLGAAFTGLATASGYLAYEKILLRHKVVEGALILAACGLCFWGLLQMTQARGTMVEKLLPSGSSKSFVDNNTVEEDTSPETVQNTDSTEEKVRNLLTSAIAKIMFSADIMLGIFLGLFTKSRTDGDFIAWHNLKTTAKYLASLEQRSNKLLSSIEIAKKQCMAGILRAKHLKRKKCVPYHQALPLLLLVLFLGVSPVTAQTNRQEGILIDVSGSVGKGGANDELFREYLVSVKKLLLTEPPDSRVWVSVITTESFGSVRSLLRGWTPEAQGIFTDDLDRARHQLATSFEAKSAGLSPAAAGTDIIGGLWQIKALLESGSKVKADAVPKTIWILSDMMNESPAFNMPALLPTGPQQMVERAKANGLVIPLAGYRVYVIGASPAGLSPKTWNSLRTFWTLYFREAGAELIMYSAECVGRE